MTLLIVFERSLDITQVINSSDLAAGLIQKYAQGKIGGLSQSGLKPKESSEVINSAFPKPINYWAEDPFSKSEINL